MPDADIVADRSLYPPRVIAPPAPLPLWRFLPTFLANPLRTVPESVYHQPMVVPPNMRGRTAWVTDPALVERVLLDDHESFPKSPIERRIFRPIIGDGILTAEGASWRWQRRTVAPLFRHADLLASVPAIADAAERMIARWRTEGRHRRAIDADMTDVTFDVLEATLFAGAMPQESARLKHHISAYLARSSWDIAFEILQLPEWVWHPARPAMRRSARILTETMRTIVGRERSRGWPGGGLMARLGTARDPETGAAMADDLIMHNLLTFAAAGHETTAKALTWALYLLARAPQWQQRLATEVDRVVGDAPIRSEHLDALVLTRQVIKEAMRLYPPAPVLARMTRHPTSLGGYDFPAGAILIIPIYVVHRHRKLWSDADRFDPSRFAPERESLHARTQFMPFGFGPRTCIGMSFAMIEAIVLLASFMRATRVSCASTLAPEPISRVTLRPRGGMPLSIDLARE